MNKIQGLLKEQNGRIRKNEVSIGWFKGLFVTLSAFIGWIFKKGV